MVRWFLVNLIKLYQKTISPFLPGCCRFYPTCSEYGIWAIEEHGVLKGLFFLLKRLFRCHPLCKGGIDVVPEPSKIRRR